MKEQIKEDFRTAYLEQHKLLEFWKTWKPGFDHWPGVDA